MNRRPPTVPRICISPSLSVGQERDGAALAWMASSKSTTTSTTKNNDSAASKSPVVGAATIVLEKPKRALTAYNIYFQVKRQEMLADKKKTCGSGNEKGVGFAAMARNVAAMWKQVAATEKAHYESLAAQDRQRHANETATWKRARKEAEQHSTNHLIGVGTGTGGDNEATVVTTTATRKERKKKTKNEKVSHTVRKALPNRLCNERSEPYPFASVTTTTTSSKSPPSYFYRPSSFFADGGFSGNNNSNTSTIDNNNESFANSDILSQWRRVGDGELAEEEGALPQQQQLQLVQQQLVRREQQLLVRQQRLFQEPQQLPPGPDYADSSSSFSWWAVDSIPDNNNYYHHHIHHEQQQQGNKESPSLFRCPIPPKEEEEEQQQRRQPAMSCPNDSFWSQTSWLWGDAVAPGNSYLDNNNHDNLLLSSNLEQLTSPPQE